MPPIVPQYVAVSDFPGFAGSHSIAAAVRFTTAEVAADDPGVLRVPIPQIGERELVEAWMVDAAPRRSAFENIRLAETDDILIGMFSTVSAGPLNHTARTLYTAIAQILRDRRFPHLIRMWNQMSRINEDDGGLERYRQFCAGRYEGFEAEGWREDSFPAGTGVGTNDRDAFACYFVASRRTPCHIENPRQVEAYRYPREYGPRSPSFARGTRIDWDDERQLYISGTASVIGHRSVHVGDLGAQVDETLRNIVAVMDAAEAGELSALSMLKVYVRDAGDVAFVRDRLESAGLSVPAIFLRSDICRAELLVEIEGVCRF
ncbi:MAG: chorismate transformation enzyme, FkbO/Hyg5 family [Thermoanaerobaculia bacterium]